MRLINRLVPLVLLPFIASTASAQETSTQVEAAQAAAQDWIALVDSAAFVESWEEAAPVFQSGVTQEQWAQTLEQQVRGQVGMIQERTLLDSQYRTSLPNAPEGDYVVLQYASSFERLPQAMEMIVMMKTDEGTWKAAGYQVQPAQQGQQPQGRQPQQGQSPEDRPPGDQTEQDQPTQENHEPPQDQLRPGKQHNVDSEGSR